MAFGLASGQANAILAALTGQGAAYGPSAALYVKLHTGDPGAAGASNAAGNTTRAVAAFAAPSGGSIASNADVAWTNVGTAETYSHVSFWTASSGGTFLGSDDLAVSRTVAVGDNFTIASGSLTLALSPIAA